MFFKVIVFKKFANFTGKRMSVLKLQVLRTAALLKESKHRFFSCKFCELSKNTYFVEDL